MNPSIEKFFNIRMIAVLCLLKKEGPMLMKDMYRDLSKYYRWYQGVQYTVGLLEKSGDVEKGGSDLYSITHIGKKRLLELQAEFYALMD